MKFRPLTLRSTAVFSPSRCNVPLARKDFASVSAALVRFRISSALSASIPFDTGDMDDATGDGDSPTVLSSLWQPANVVATTARTVNPTLVGILRNESPICDAAVRVRDQPPPWNDVREPICQAS